MTVPRSNASHDQNFQSTMMGVSTADGTTPVPLEVDPTTGAFTTMALIDKPYDYVAMSNPDANSNYQTFTYKTGGSGGTTVRTLTYTYDGSNNVTSITRS